MELFSIFNPTIAEALSKLVGGSDMDEISISLTDEQGGGFDIHACVVDGGIEVTANAHTENISAGIINPLFKKVLK